MTCHCGRPVAEAHWTNGEGEDLAEIHATRCCACADSFAFGAPDCESCETEGERP